MKFGYKVLLVDLLFVVALYFVFSDLSWRTYYAMSPHDACGGLCSYTPSFSFSLLTRFFTMAGNGVSLTSPPTLDWVQVIVVLLVAVNGWTAFDSYRSWKYSRSRATLPP